MRRALAAVAALAMLGGCGGHSKDGGGDVVTFQKTQGSTAAATSPATKTAPAKANAPARTSPSSTTGGGTSSGGAGNGSGNAKLFTISVPASWTRKDSTLAGGIQRSEWRDPSHAGTSVLVDAVAGANSTPKERAARNRDRGATKAGYREDDFSSISLGGRPGFVWEYELGDRRIVDYFLNDCGNGYAIQGTAPTIRFAGAARAFHEAAASLRSTHC